MKVILLTTLVFLLVPIIHVFLDRLLEHVFNSVKCMFITFVLYFTACLSLHALFSPKQALLDYFAICSLAGFYCLGYMEVFSMLCRGFSLHIMIDIYEGKSLDIEGIKMKYGAGKGIDWLFNKRIANMRALGLVDIEGGFLKIRPFGALVGRLGLLMKNGLKMGAGG